VNAGTRKPLDKASVAYVMDHMGYDVSRESGRRVFYRHRFSQYEPIITLVFPEDGILEEDLRWQLVDYQGITEALLNVALEQL